MYFYCSYLLSPIPYIRVLLFLLQWSFSDDLALSKSFFIFFVERTIFLILKGDVKIETFSTFDKRITALNEKEEYVRYTAKLFRLNPALVLSREYLPILLGEGVTVPLIWIQTCMKICC